jgi:hypothetical protein
VVSASFPNLYRYVNNDPVNYTDPSGLKPTKESGAAELRKALDIMYKLCECCVDKDKIQKCKDDAKKIVDALVDLWTKEFGKGPYGNTGDPVGGYFCWDWASGFKKAANDVGSDIWTASFRRFAADERPDGSIPVHYAARLSIKNPKKEKCELTVDDGFFDNGLVHEPPWPSRTDYKEDTNNPTPRKTCLL